MNKIYLLLLALVVTVFAAAQDKSVLDRLGAYKLPGQEVFIIFDAAKSEFNYKLAATGIVTGQIEKETYFSYNGGNLFHAHVGAINPVRYKIEVNSTVTDNPTLQAYDDFLKTFSAPMATVSPLAEPIMTTARSVDPSKLKKSELEKYSRSLNISTIDLKKESLITYFELDPKTPLTFSPKVQTVLLREWYYQLLLQQASTYNEEEDNKLATLVNDFEQVLYRKFAIKDGGETKTVEEWLDNFKSALYTPTDFTKFKEAHIAVKASLGLLRAIVEKADASYAEIKKILKVTDPGSFLSGSSLSETFENYSINTLGYLTSTADPLLQTKKSKVKEFGDYMNAFENDLSDFKDHILKMQKRKDLKIKITITELDQNGKALEKKNETEFHVIYHQPLVPYVSAAIAWSPHKFYDYTINKDADGAATIAETVSKRYWQPALFLNWFLNVNTSDFHIILPQIGIGTGGELPVVYTGLGFAVFDRFAISGGVSYAFEKMLKDKQDGDSINSEAELEGYIDRKVSYKGYMSLTYRIGD